MFFINVDYPSALEERRIARETTGVAPAPLNKLITGEQVLAFQDVVQRVPVPDHIYDAAVDLVRRSRPRSEEARDWIQRWVTWGAGPRAVQYLIRGAKARSVLHGSYLVRMEDLEAVAEPVLTHRILTNFQAQSEGITSATIIDRLQGRQFLPGALLVGQLEEHLLVLRQPEFFVVAGREQGRGQEHEAEGNAADQAAAHAAAALNAVAHAGNCLRPAQESTSRLERRICGVPQLRSR